VICVLATGVAASVLAGCRIGSDADRTAYVDANVAILDELPRFPGSTPIEEVSTPHRQTESGPIVGYGTRRDLTLPPNATADAVLSFYERELPPSWEVVERLVGPVRNLRRGSAALSINLESWRAHRYEIAVDHAYYPRR
jgi:hypothetical protein